MRAAATKVPRRRSFHDTTVLISKNSFSNPNPKLIFKHRRLRRFFAHLVGDAWLHPHRRLSILSKSQHPHIVCVSRASAFPHLATMPWGAPCFRVLGRARCRDKRLQPSRPLLNLPKLPANFADVACPINAPSKTSERPCIWKNTNFRLIFWKINKSSTWPQRPGAPRRRALPQ